MVWCQPGKVVSQSFVVPPGGVPQGPWCRDVVWCPPGRVSFYSFGVPPGGVPQGPWCRDVVWVPPGRVAFPSTRTGQLWERPHWPVQDLYKWKSLQYGTFFGFLMAQCDGQSGLPWLFDFPLVVLPFPPGVPLVVPLPLGSPFRGFIH